MMNNGVAWKSPVHLVHFLVGKSLTSVDVAKSGLTTDSTPKGYRLTAERFFEAPQIPKVLHGVSARSYTKYLRFFPGIAIFF